MQKEFNLSVKKIYQIITKLITLIEIDLQELETGDSGLKNKKNITDLLTKITSIISNIKKLNLTHAEDYKVLSLKDQKILDEFIKKYNKKS